jgi:hypothetical protein
MTPEDIEKAIHDGISAALTQQLQPAIDKAVNGKVKALSNQMTPITEAFDKWNSWKKGVIILLGMFVAVGSFIQSAETFWTAFTHYLTIIRTPNP